MARKKKYVLISDKLSAIPELYSMIKKDWESGTKKLVVDYYTITTAGRAC
jgi:hypothetical protein